MTWPGLVGVAGSFCSVRIGERPAAHAVGASRKFVSALTAVAAIRAAAESRSFEGRAHLIWLNSSRC